MNRRPYQQKQPRRSLRWLIVPGAFAAGMAVGAWMSGPDAPEEQAPTKTPVAAMFFQDLRVAPPAEASAPVPVQSDHKVLSVSIEGSIPRSLSPEVGPLADALSAEVSRLLVWDLDLRRDLRAGDRLEVVWDGTSPETIEVHAVRLESGKLGRSIEAYRFKASGDRYASFWTAGGSEVPRRLVSSPIEDYEQVTSLLKDRPRHKGMDFKAAVGVPVTTPREGVVTKTNWNLAANGNCAELRFEDGVVAKYLHLSRTDVAAGQRLHPGAQVGLVGNTGRSTGAHLHYQLERGKTVVDPLDYHGTERRTLPVQDSADLQKTIDRLRLLLDSSGQPSA